ncbi:3-phosphoshikimate 1-carboxyvinyltransferase [Fusobacterium necrophorum subsp. funduliforme ATCC 51357]|uniref:3-phosphoshikimate 1-carboxyvinyltransferase n=1 Tax=Fusobacterium necrophorum subsp. funduliforme TaxID=143387 RepID=A0A162J994_9FUSO|nr:3-phosphoshikimate 1-carboxyvinyltransferase [Fusobacterium necrophorum]AYV92920.1 3-phosphoshikimate 1-carboxyvinyltransferase [Fusobacterium necrophorum subsp. funduliforme]EIJ68859.1 3-phosphoshikimate 1-carboxyvinyltransferase [Fusobacterium necrophorum subsp. funduliforme ATCC 51357]KAB0554056.1 3-phosphoshikimate 1-carboxyvinyltransferase [Fusobacterium necrophorum subsp. funduliforme]KYL05373.1 3-phosphoshikimate 1-carboxyvinyltransferase [Fusobacterium necrophorum subsp. funduliforme
MKLFSNRLKGKLQIPASKSYCHRYIIAASLAKEMSILHNISLSDDIQSTIENMKKLGAKIEQREQDFLIQKGDICDNQKNFHFFCSESASTLRFLIPLSLIQYRKVSFYGRNTLPNRPLSPFFPILNSSGISFRTEGENSLCIQLEGQLKAGNYSLEGNISSQFITGLLFALPLLDGNSQLHILGNLESKAYVDMSLDVLEKFKIQIFREKNHFFIPGKQEYQAYSTTIEGDYSQAAFFLVANSMGNEIEIAGLTKDSKQADFQISSMIQALEEKVPQETLILDGSQCPDIIPILSVKAALTQGKTVIQNIKRLRMKECDRLHATADILNKLGAKVVENSSSLEFEGVSHFKGNSVSSFEDHRMAMMIAVASTRCQGEILLDNATCVSKSYPTFWEDFKSLGGKYVLG